MTTYLYARISTDDKGQSVDNQIEAVLAERGGVTIVITDEGVSGTVHPTKRSGFNRILKTMKKGDTIVAVAFDRVSRKTIDFLNLIELLSSKGVALVTLRERLDTTTSQGYLLATQMMAFAQLERDIISERTKAALNRLKDNNVTLGRKVTKETVQAKKMICDGVSLAEVIKVTGISRATAYRLKNAAQKPLCETIL
ncbi:recombinase family protein [Buttiauxella noackiae]|uniref:recombinase family protein n=1 Tax=Buttiauxella noackiae TaxID=82992 RepID=UPI00068BF6BE|nr:recombinase family protein [Buttiauxella noackiae]